MLRVLRTMVPLRDGREVYWHWLEWLRCPDLDSLWVA